MRSEKHENECGELQSYVWIVVSSPATIDETDVWRVPNEVACSREVASGCQNSQ